MEKYTILNKLGSGAYGTVRKAENKLSREIVAIKVLYENFSSWQECLHTQEVKLLRKLRHPNIIKLLEIIRNRNKLFLVFDYMNYDLKHLIKQREIYPISESEIKNWCFQIFTALAYMHQLGYIHRDLKPANLLINEENDVIKIADFGMARDTNPGPYTPFMVTLPYRAPEISLGSWTYNSKIDMWAMGAIMAELFNQEILFQSNNDCNHVANICKIIGSPSEELWSQGLGLAKFMNYQFPQFSSRDLSKVIPSASEDTLSLIGSLLSWDPCKRPTATEALQHPFFTGCHAGKDKLVDNDDEEIKVLPGKGTSDCPRVIPTDQQQSFIQFGC